MLQWSESLLGIECKISRGIRIRLLSLLKICRNTRNWIKHSFKEIIKAAWNLSDFEMLAQTLASRSNLMEVQTLFYVVLETKWLLLVYDCRKLQTFYQIHV